jgi:Protein of unknown function (DUF4238)
MPWEPSPAPLQHITPRHYLKGFADSAARTHVWVYNKGQAYSTGNEVNPRRNPFRQAIRSAGTTRGAYSLVTLTGDRIDADPAITQQEEWGVTVLRKLRAREPISVDDKVRFSLYIDLMLHRVAARTAHALPLVRKAMRENLHLDWLQRKAADEGRFDLARMFDPRVPENVAAMERELVLRGMVRRSPTIVKQIAMMRWLFFTVDGDRFFPTTDNPAFWPGLGLSKDNGFILMPIDSQMVLLVSNLAVDDRQYVPTTPVQYTLWRNVTLAGATEKAFACRNDPDILAMLDNPKLPTPVPTSS